MRDIVKECAALALAGASGRGKTTVTDLSVELLPVAKGRLAAGGIAVDDTNVVRWQRLVGHVPQQI